MNVQHLRQKVEALEAERAIRDTMSRYCHATDYGLAEAFADLFTNDGLLLYLTKDGEPFFRKEGRAELAGYVAGKPRPPERYDKHIVLAAAITLEGSTARVRSYFASLQDTEKGPCIASYGRYRDLLVKEDGRWRFKERIAEVEAVVPSALRR